MPGVLYLDTSAVLRATLESGLSNEVEQRLRDADALITSRLALVESARALHRVRIMGQASEAKLADAQRSLDALWSRCSIWEITREVCDLAGELAPRLPLRALDALHLATFALAKRRIDGIEILTIDERMLAAVRGGI